MDGLKNTPKVYCKSCIYHAQHHLPSFLVKSPAHICLRLSTKKVNVIGEKYYDNLVDCEMANKDHSCQYHRKWWEFWKK